MSVVEPLDATLGAVVHGVRVSEMSELQWREVEAAFNEHGMLVFPEQHPSREEQIAFGERWGALEERGGTQVSVPLKASDPMVLEISNILEDGSHVTSWDHPRTRALAGNEGWHSDSSFRPAAAKVSLLAAIETPRTGGQTSFADMRAAYDVLPEDMKKRLEGLVAWHSVRYSQAVVGVSDDEPAADPEAMEGAWHPLVNRHPVTGRRSLFVGRHACKVAGMDILEGQALLAGLLEDSCRRPRVYSHSWTNGDVVVWDNRCLLHRAGDWDLTQRRRLRHVRIAGDPNDQYHNPDAASVLAGS